MDVLITRMDWSRVGGLLDSPELGFIYKAH